MFDFIVLVLINILGIKFFGSWFVVFEIIALFIFLIWLWIKKYRPIIDSVSLFTGAPGTGKTKVMTDFAIRKYNHNYRMVKFYNFFVMIWKKIYKRSKREYQELPLLISNYPIRLGLKKRKQYKQELHEYRHNMLNAITVEEQKSLKKPSKYIYSKKLSLKAVLLQERLPLKSVVAITEFSSLAHNQDFKNEYVKDNIDEWIRFFRQYTKGGWLFMDDQASDLIMAQVRRRIGKVYNMMSFQKVPLLKIGIVRIRHLSISEDIKVVEEGQAESLSNTSWFPVFFYINRYDTYAFSDRVKDMEVVEAEEFKQLKTNELMELPFEHKKGYNKPTKTKKTD